MKLTTNIFTAIILVLTGMFLFYACKKPPIEMSRTAELIVTNYDGGNVEWVSIQEGISADAKVADAKQDRGDIVQSNDTLYIQLTNVNDTLPFTASDKYTVVLKHDNKDKMYIKFSVKFTNGLADLKWGSWLAW
ncbi:MAG: hypothetical protein LBE13_02335 [Bacteroidales bacterium]|jgi:hypothetical protein|nr:hypothetical protein [Bacteroidales bacterium]